MSLTKEMKEAPHAWCSFVDDGNEERLVTLQVPEDVMNNPKSHFNSKEGIKARYESERLLNSYKIKREKRK